MQIWILRSNEKYGPYSEEQVVEFGQNGQLSPEDRLWHSDLAGWEAPMAVLPGLELATPERAASVEPVEPPEAGQPSGRDRETSRTTKGCTRATLGCGGLLALLLLVFLASKFIGESPRNVPQADCLHEVFDQFCLGGPASTLDPDKAMEISPGLLGFRIDGEKVMVTVVEDRIASVGRGIEPGTWRRYQEVLTSLRARYGEDVDDSSFPGDAGDPRAKETAVHRGEGGASHLWPRGQWHLGLSWKGSESMWLIYSHDELLERLEEMGSS